MNCWGTWLFAYKLYGVKLISVLLAKNHKIK